MTLNSPYEELVAAGLEPIKIELPGGRLTWRQIWFAPRMMKWWMDELPVMDPDLDIRGPVAQVGAFFRRFNDGQKIQIKEDDDYGEGVRLMRPSEDGIWEMCISDVRIFGWFRCMDNFVATNAGSARSIKGKGERITAPLYSGYRNEARDYRKRLGLQQPDHVAGMEYANVLSDRN